ncbi:Transposase [Oligella urethralis]|uniref:IS1634 family transposase n=1 Tax=Oligella sp. HMSC09E12 TaxID=1581147 RepID=UPI0009F67EAB|nr:MULTISPECIES: IS1634 family transposase [Oligella]PMC15063.1 transposase [Oligella urethralis]SUA54423.1 Transposase [Oligella urethralis]SUA59335.1 Transposase [Oligella urethralis]
MFVREKKNKSGSVSIQVVSKKNGTYKVLKFIGCATTHPDIERFKLEAEQYIVDNKPQLSFDFDFTRAEEDEQAVTVVSSLQNNQIHVIDPELIFGRIYDAIGFNRVPDELFRHLVIARLAYPFSKLKTITYLLKYCGVKLEISAIYRFLDRLADRYQPLVEQIAFEHTKRMQGGLISVVFYDMTTLHFEAEDDDDLRQAGFSKVGKHTHPQIYLGLLVGANGFPIAYDIFAGKSYEGHTLIPFLERFSVRFNLGKPFVVADSGLLTKANIEALKAKDYTYIIGARLKTESAKLKREILTVNCEDGLAHSFTKDEAERLIVHYSSSRAQRDKDNRRKGLERLQQRLRSGKLTKSHLNNRGYNKYLKMHGEIHVAIEMEKYESDAAWDGLKGYVTNTTPDAEELLAHYGQLRQIAKTFRIMVSFGR